MRESERQQYPELYAQRAETRLSERQQAPTAYVGAADRRKAPQAINRPAFERSGWKVILTLVLVCGLSVSGVSSWAWYAYTSSLHRQSVETSLTEVKSILGPSLERDSDLLATVNAEVATHPQLTNAALAAVLSKLDLSQRYPGSFAFTYVENVSRADLPRFEATARRDPSLGTVVARSPSIKPSLNGRSGYCLIRLVSVELSGEGILKNVLLTWISPYISSYFNFCASSFESLYNTSAQTGASVAASVVSLLRPAPGLPPIPATLHSLLVKLPIFIEVSPVYAGTTVPSSPKERAEALIGWTMAVFDANEILSPALTSGKGVSLVLAYAPPGGRPAVLARAGPTQDDAAAETISFPADPGWIIDAAVSSRESGPSPVLQGLAVLFGATALTLLLVILLGLLIRSRRTALELVEERTAELRHQALHDSLTGLPNRFLVNQRAHQIVNRARTGGLPIAVFFIDLDDFKKVNDTLGHDVGDGLLRAVATRLTEAVRSTDTVGRLGGDEFVLLSETSFSDGGLGAMAERLLAVLREPFCLGDATRTTLSTSASIGIATGMRSSPEELLRNADIAMYRAKSMGKNCYVLFEPEMHEIVKRQLTMETDLAEAFLKREFFLLYQPIVDLETGLPRDFEALLRWQHPERGVVGPGEFIHVLESSDLIIDVGRFVLMEACRQVKAWHELGSPVGISVNVGARQLRYDVLIDHVREALEAAELDACYLTVEVTESMLMINSNIAAQRLVALSELGVRVAIDDFGTGYASLSYLREFPADVLKIDRSFVSQLTTSSGSNFLDALIHLGKSLGLKTIAEGIEETAQLDHVKRQGCDWGQGFLFSKPVPPEDIRQIIRRSHYEVGSSLTAGATVL
ncbi:MAG: EAL domain-containing protein [Acidimicrobiales bacterium]|jgi:diguanylate cyclase (GGDEF)-like protein